MGEKNEEKKHKSKIKGPLDECGVQLAELEQTADEMVALESRAEMAEAERDGAAEAMAAMTPRPARPLPAAQAVLGTEGLALLQTVVLHYRCALPECVTASSMVNWQSEKLDRQRIYTIAQT